MIPGKDSRISFVNVGSGSDIVIYLFHLSLQNKILNYESNPLSFELPFFPPSPHPLRHWLVASSDPSTPMSSSHKPDKRPHVCPPSNAVHPSDRWESLFIYSFICKFTNLRQKIEGLESPMEWANLPVFLARFWPETTGILFSSLENALLSKEPNSILSQLLVQFIVNLKPQTRNLRWAHLLWHH